MMVYDDILDVLRFVRSEFESRYGTGQALCGLCDDASGEIVARLAADGVSALVVDGWVLFDDEDGCTDDPFDSHTWVEIDCGGTTFVADVTADQFNSHMYAENEFPPVILSDALPYGFSYDAPVI